MYKHASLNRQFRIIWSSARQAWVAVAEHTAARGKSKGGVLRRTSKLAALGAAGLLSGLALAAPPPGELPGGGQVVGGAASIGSAGSAMTIHQSSHRAVIDWNTFNVGGAASVDFIQPSSSSATLNRVLDNNPSQIAGRISANGQVIISNPNGVLFTPGARVDVGALTATTHSISTHDFMTGLNSYSRDGASGSVVNQGELNAALGGYIALLAPEVRNEGVIVAQAGSVALVSGEVIRLDFDGGERLVGITASPSEVEALVENRHAVYAPGGLIILSARAADQLQGGVVRNSGTLSASSLSAQGGRILLGGDEVQLTASSVVEARGASQGGQIEIHAERAELAGRLDVGGASGGSLSIEVGEQARIAAILDASGSAASGGSIRIAQHEQAAASAVAGIEIVADALLDSAGVTDGGQIELEAVAAISVEAASLDASAAEGDGGHIELYSQTAIALADAALRADGAANGGSIHLATAELPPEQPSTPLSNHPDIALIGNTRLGANGRRGQGGSVRLTGRDLSLADGSRIDASGATGGGTVLVGGDWQGAGELPQASRVSFGSDALIDASATGNGDGGTVVLWSDVTLDDGFTRANGTILARGGAQGGDGGRIETSGHAVSTDGIRVDAGAGAGHGNGGLWLIDPYNYTITQTQANTIASALNNNTSVTVTTTANNTSYGSSGNSSQVGNITVNSNVSIAKSGGNGNATLTLQAHSNISFGSGSSVTSTSGKLNLVLWSRLNPGNAGTIHLDSTTINTNGGHVWMGGGAAATSQWNGLAVGNSVAATSSQNTPGLRLTSSTITTSGGHFYAGGQGNYTGTSAAGYSLGVRVGGTSISTGSGSLTLQGEIRGNHTTADNVSAGLFVAEGSTLSSGSGSITLQGTASASNSPAGIVFGTYLTNKSTIRSGSGAINVYGSTTANSVQGAGIWLGSSRDSGGSVGDGNQSSGVGNGYNVAVVSNSGNVLFDARAQSTRSDSWMHGFTIVNYGSDKQLVKTTSGNITIKGDADVQKNDSSGVQFQVNTATGNIHVVSASGDIYVQGFQHSGSTHAYNNALRFTPGASAGSIRFGAVSDAASYTGRLTFEADSIWNNTINTSSASAIKAYGSGAIGFLSSGSSSVKDFTLTSFWDFGSAHSSVSIGKPTESKTVTLDSAITAAGPITVYGGNIVLNNNLSSTRAGAAIRLLASGSITSTSSTGTTLTLTSNAGDVILASASRGASSGNIDFQDQALSIDTRPGTAGAKSTSGSGGGNITLGGGNTLGSGYATGVGSDSAEGIRARNLTLRSGGGEVNLRGRSWAGAVANGYGGWGIGVYQGSTTGNLTIDSGTGRIRLEGIGRSTGTGSYKQGIAVYGVTDIRSAYAGNDAIRLDGSVTATSGTEEYRSAVYLLGTATLAATGSGGGLSIHGNTTYASLWLGGAAYVLGNGGDLNISGTQLAGGSNNLLRMLQGSNVWFGSVPTSTLASSPITSTDSALLLEFDGSLWSGRPNIATSGAVTVQSNAASFNQDIYSRWFNWNPTAQRIGGLTFGKSSNSAYGIYLSGSNEVSGSVSSLIVNGPVTAYGKFVEVIAPLTITGDGDIYLRSYQDGNGSLVVGSTISKTGGGDATLTLRGNGRVTVSGDISASGTGTGALNMVVWADADGNRLGGASLSANYSTNGGHFWIGGGSGSVQWNGLTVGDGASPGAYGSNHNGIDLNATVNTGGGDFYAAGKSFVSGSPDISPTRAGNAATIDAGGGDITFVGNRIYFGRSDNQARTTVNTTGTLSIRPWDDSFSLDFNVVGSLAGNDWVGTTGSGSDNTGTYNFTIKNAGSLGGLVIGKETNTSQVSVYNSLSILGDINIYAGQIRNQNSASLTSTAGSILLDADLGRGLDFNAAGIGWTGGSLTASSSADDEGNITLLGRGGSKANTNHGVLLSNTSLQAGGDLLVRGLATGQGSTGVSVTGAATVLDAGRTLALDGRNLASASSANNRGVLLNAGVHLAAVDALGVTGQSGPGSAYALELGQAVGIDTTHGDIRIAALAGGSIASRSGGNGNASTITAGNGADITLSADRLSIDASRPLTLSTTGTLTIEPNSNSFPTAFAWDGDLLSGNFTGFAGSSLAHVTIANVDTLGGLTLGKQTNLSDIVVATDAAMQAAGPIRLFGQHLTLAGRITAQGNADEDDDRIELHARGSVTQGDEALSAHALSLQGGGRFTLTAHNNVDTLATGGIGNLSFVNNGTLTVGSVSNTDGSQANGISASGKVRVETLSGDLNLHGNVSSGSTATDALVLNAGRAKSLTDLDFHSGAGGSITAAGGISLTTGSGGRATLYSGSVAASTGLADLVGSGSGRFRYASDEVTTAYISPLGTGLHAVYREQPTLTLQGVEQTLVYGNDAALQAQASGLLNGDSTPQSIGRLPTVTLMDGASAATRNAAGHLNVRRDGSGNVTGYDMALSRDAVSVLGYALAYDDSASVTVTPRALSAVINDDAKFVGLADSAGYAGATFSGFARGETAADVSANATITRSIAGETLGTYANALTGSVAVAAGNYVLDPANVTAGTYHIVDPSTLIVSVGSASAVYGDAASYDVARVRYYNEASNSEVSLVQGASLFDWHLAGNPEQVVQFTLDSAGINVGTHAITGTVITPHALPGTNSSTTPSQLLAIGGRLTITPRSLTLSASKVYDGSDALGAGALTLGNLAYGDTLGYSGGRASDRNVATAGKYVSELTLTDGTGLASNYQLPSLAAYDATGNSVLITPRALGVTVDKVYDGLASASAAQTTLSNLAAGETLAILDVQLSDAHVATSGKYVNSLTLDNVTDGASGAVYYTSNYSLPGQAAGITAGALNVLGASAINTVTITPQTLTVRIDSASGALKTYDGSTGVHSSFAAVLDVEGYVAGDSGTLDYEALYDTKNIDAEQIHLNDLALTGIASTVGSQASDYLIDGSSAFVAGSIAARTVNAAASGNPTKVYDGTTSANGAQVSLAAATASEGKVGGDDLSILAAGGSFSDANAGSGRTYSLLDITLAGDDARNYVLSSGTISGSDGVITPRTLTLEAGKVYDGGTALDSVTLGNLVQGEYLNLVAATARSARVGGPDGDTSTLDNYISSIQLSNVLDGSTPIYLTANYSLPGGTAGVVSGVSNSLLAAPGNRVTITPVLLSVQLDATQVGKIYDGSATLSDSARPAYLVTGLVDGDTAATLTQAASAFNSANVAEADTFTLSGIAVSGVAGGNGSAASDYVLDTTTLSLPGSITARAVAVNSDEVNKVYDGTTGFDNLAIGLTSVAGDSSSGLIAADAGSVSVQAAGGGFDSSQAGSGKSYTLTGLTLAGSAASNYQIASGDSISGLDGEIERRQIQVQDIIASDKTYDGLTTASVTAGMLSGLVAGESLTFTTSGAFANKNAGTGITVDTVTTLGDGSDGSGLASNYVLSNANGSTTATIERRTVTLSQAVASDKVYDGNTQASVSAGTLSGLVAGESLTVMASGTFADKNVGTGIAVDTLATLVDGSDGSGLAGNYVLSNANGSTTATIERRAVSVSPVVASDKVYDGNIQASVSAGVLDNLVAGESLAITASGAFADKNAGTGITVDTVTTLGDGSDGSGLASNYVLSNANGSTTATIERRALTVSPIAASDKVYDGNVQASVSAGTLSGLVAGESLAVTASGTFADKNAGTGITVNTVTTLGDGSEGNGLASNYVLSNANGSTTATIERRAVSVAQVAASDKVYDGNVQASVSAGTLSGLVAGESLAVTASGTFADKNVGTGIAVDTLVTLVDGSDGSGLAGNYVLSNANGSTTATIERRAVSVSQVVASDKVYDGNVQASVSAGVLDNLVAGESLAITASGTFADKNAGTGITVDTVTTLGDSSEGNGLASNYVLSNANGSTTATIERKTLTVVGLEAADKTYDGSNTAIVADLGRVDTGVGNETLALAATSATFANASAGTGKTVTVTGYTLFDGAQGGQAGNYQLSSTSATTTANIERAILTVIANDDARFVIQADSASYNGVSYSGFVAGETSAVLGGTTSVVRSNPSENQAGIYLDALQADVSGLSAENYSFVTRSGSYTIVPSNQLLVRMAAASSTYGTQASYALASAEYEHEGTIYALNGTLEGNNRFMVQDGVGGSATFSVTPEAPSLSGSGALRSGVYQLGIGELSTTNAQNFSDTLTLVGHQSVTSKAVTANAEAGVGKVYDGGNAMSELVIGFDGVRAGDTLGATGIGLFSTSNAGSGINYTVGGLMLSGSDAGNYHLSGGTSFSGDDGVIAKRSLAVDYTGVDKVYDGSAAATVTAQDNRIGGDTLQLDWSAVFADRNAGTGKLIDISGITLGGADAGNYTLVSTTASTTANILQREVTVSEASASDKVYDGSTSAAVTAGSLSNLVEGETLTVSASGAFVDRNAGAGVAVDTTTYIADGANGLASNYILSNATGTTSADIDQRTLLVDFSGVDKVYDGNTSAAVTTSDNRIDGDLLQVALSANFADKNVGTDKRVLIEEVALSGADAANYRVAATGETAASITRRDSATWIGGDTGNWFDPANWADGAVPDLSNVANVVIPDGVEVTFGPDIVAPAESGPVNVDSLDGAGGSLVQNGGELHVGSGGVTLDSLTQADGVLTSDGPIDLGSFSQTGGSTATDGDFSVDGDFSQGSDGSLAVVGNADIRDDDGGVTLGNISVDGDLSVTSEDGDIEQAAGTTIVIGGETTVDAGNGDIVLDGENNDFAGPINAIGGDISLVDGSGGLILGDIEATGDLQVTSSDGDIVQEGGSTIAVGGETTVDAGNGDIVLDGENNDFAGPINASGNDISLVDGSGGLILGDIEATGDLEVVSSDGDISQESGSAIQVAGSTVIEVTAADSSIRLTGSGNSFGGGLSLVGNRADDLPEVIRPSAPSLPLPTPNNAPPVLGAWGEGLKGFDSGLSVLLLRVPSLGEVGLVMVRVPQDGSATGFSFLLPERLTEGQAADVEIRVALADGSALPAWLRFVSATRTFVADSVPTGGLPLEVEVVVGDSRTIVLVSEEND
ncbi:YDG domain-containing protein [Stutzerimonas kirkiae]|uniref:YDG domain-containing protein n=1 Tax=Stutzerimonas kirkiae TaxID=2211392 RepID=UPI0010382E62|nr:YDG domain-containing protein [Stutzerimonas kirkiae]TBV12352.1 hypothetical protein DNK08_00505 [Stutzerimonas kirkiae]